MNFDTSNDLKRKFSDISSDNTITDQCSDQSEGSDSAQGCGNIHLGENELSLNTLQESEGANFFNSKISPYIPPEIISKILNHLDCKESEVVGVGWTEKSEK